MVLTLQSLQRSFSTQVMELAERKRQEKQKELEDNMTEITNLLHGDLLSENPQQAASSFGPHRVVPDRWKGMSKEQLEEIRFTQKQQIQEKLVSSSWATGPPLHPQAAPTPSSCVSAHSERCLCCRQLSFRWEGNKSQKLRPHMMCVAHVRDEQRMTAGLLEGRPGFYRDGKLVGGPCWWRGAHWYNFGCVNCIMSIRRLWD